MAKQMDGSVGISLAGFGEYLRYLRRTHGYKNPDELAAVMRDRAGYYISRDTIWRIERGKQDPTLTFLCALSIALSEEIFSYELLDGITANACAKWQEINQETATARARKGYRDMGLIELEKFDYLDDETKAILDMGFELKAVKSDGERIWVHPSMAEVIYEEVSDLND